MNDLFASVSETDLGPLHDRLVAAAQADGLLDVAYRTLDTPVGTLLLAATEQGLVRVAYAVEDHDAVLADAGRPGQPAGAARRRAGSTRRRGSSTSTSPGPVARSTCRWTGGCRPASGAEVLRHLPEIGYGHTESYAQVAEAAGNARAVRAVGSACATNPLPVVVPCHRVVRSDGSIGGYAGGPAAKRALLTLEGVGGL